MPPYGGGARKTSLATPAVTLTNGASESARRTTSGRAVRANATRPANYYARPFTITAQEDNEELAPNLGFFPAVTFFTDAVAALPREVVRQMTLVKEVEAKIHGPAAQLGAICDELMTIPVPSKRDGQLHSALMMSFTAPNSNAGSANASLINGVAPNASRYGQDSAAESVTGEEQLAQESEENLNRRRRYAELRTLAHSMLPNLDEKNVVLSEAIRVMNVQLARIDGVMPYVENEIPEEARLGSMTHWAYSDNRIRSKGAVATSRRDVAATQSLAAAAHAVHETEIAQTRKDAVREARGEKPGRGKHREQVDSEFEDKPRSGKAGAKAAAAKGKVAAALTGLGITNGEPVKRRKVEKTAVPPPAMERQASSMGRGAVKSGRETPRSTPMVEEKKKALKPAPVQVKRRGLNSAQASPALASSPLQVQVPLATAEAPSSTRPQSARLRQNSTASNLRHENVPSEDASAPTSAIGRSNHDKPSRKRTRDEAEIDAMQVDSIERPVEGSNSPIKAEDNKPAPSRSDSSGKTPSGGASKVGTPRSDQFSSNEIGMTRTRSTRSGRGREESENARPGHKRNGGVGSMSGLMKQIAPFNRSPDLDRHRSRDVSDEDNDESNDDANERSRERSASGRRRKSGQISRPVSRHASNLQGEGESPRESGPDEQLLAEEELDATLPDAAEQDLPDVSEPPALIQDADEDEPESPSPSLTPVLATYEEPADVEQGDDELDEEEPVDEADGDVEDADEEGEDADPDDPDEPKYCYCMRGSYGDMVGCDNTDCPREWFHLGCTGLKRMPTEEESWYCDYCKPVLASRRRGVARGRGRA